MMQGIWSFFVGLFWLVLVAAIILGFIALRKYNALQALAQNVRAKASNTQVAISKKLNLINQLIDLVKSFQESEQLTHLKISQDANSAAITSAYNQSGSVLASIQGMAERFPKLRASEQYHRLIDSVQGCENDIQSSREKYNESVRIYNTERLAIPTVFVARFMGFGDAPYMEFDQTGAVQASTLKEFKTADGERLQELLTSAGSKVADTSRTLAHHAADAGRLLHNKVKDVKDSARQSPSIADGTGLEALDAIAPTGDQYFCMQAGGVPQGPHTAAHWHKLLTQGEISAEAKVCKVGGDTWTDLQDILPPTAP